MGSDHQQWGRMMNSGEPLQGAPALGLDPAVGSALVENRPALKRKTRGNPIAPRDYCDLSIGFTNIGSCVSSNKDRCLATSASSWTEIAATHAVEVSATRARSINSEATN